MSTRDEIEATLRQLNAAENGELGSSVEAKSAAIDAVMALGVSGWTNGVHVPDRAAERRSESLIFGLLADYRRDFDRLIIEPPHAALNWTIYGTVNDRPLELSGSSTFEFDDSGRIWRYWLYFDTAPLVSAMS